MAAKASGTWLKVASKGGGAKSVFVSNKLGGRAFNEGETITQSELNAHLATASKALEKQGIDAKARFPGTYKQATAKAGSSSSVSSMMTKGNVDKALANLESQIPAVQANIAKMSKREQAAARKEMKQTMAGVRPMVEEAFPGLAKRATEKMNQKAGKGGGLSKAALSKAEKTQILLKNKKEIKERLGKRGYFDQVNRMNRLEKADRKRRKQENPDAPEFARAAKAMATKQAKQASQQKAVSSSTRQQRIAEIKANINAVADDKTKTPAERYPAWRKKNYLERNAQANENANLIFGRGKGNRAKRRANAIKGNNK